jgi:hypothetical protein
MRKPPIPTRLREFVKEAAVDEDDGEHVVATVKLRCPRCSKTKFVLYWQHLREGGQTVEASPVWISCGACRYHALLFDDSSDGLNGYFDDGDVSIPECRVLAWNGAREPTYSVKVVLQYDIDPVQLDEKGELIADAYDWFSIVAEWSDGSVDDVIDFETA